MHKAISYRVVSEEKTQAVAAAYQALEEALYNACADAMKNSDPHLVHAIMTEMYRSSTKSRQMQNRFG